MKWDIAIFSHHMIWCINIYDREEKNRMVFKKNLKNFEKVEENHIKIYEKVYSIRKK